MTTNNIRKSNQNQTTEDTIQSLTIKILRERLAADLESKKFSAFHDVNLQACPELPSW